MCKILAIFNGIQCIFFPFRFGVCCVFLVTEAGTTINQNCTYIRNPGFPSAYGSTSSVAYTINKCSPGNFSKCHIKCIY